MSISKTTNKTISKNTDWEGIIRGTRTPNAQVHYFKPIAQTIIYLPPFVWVVLDIICGLAAFLFSHWASPVLHAETTLSYKPLTVGLSFGLIIAIVRHVLDNHDITHLNSAVRIFITSAIASLIAIAFITLTLNWTLYEHIGRYIVVYSFLTATLFTSMTRISTRGWITRSRHRVVFIGTPANFEILKGQLEGPFKNFFRSPIFIQVDAALSASLFRKELLATLSLFQPNEIVVEDHSLAESWVMENCLEITKAGCLIRHLSRFNEELNREEDLEVLTPRKLLMTPGLGSGAYTGQISKRIGDIFFAFTGLLLSLPIGIIVATCIKVFSPGPIFYRQKRVGRYGENFDIIKFRTMRVDAEKTGAVWASENDSRCTSLGRILRKTRLDEMPQFWNILKGDMSFVGPRPERPEFVEKLEKELPHYHLRHLVKPGLTGWAQIRYQYGASHEDAKKKLAYDLYYINHYGFVLDISIFLKTLVSIAKGGR